MVTAENLRLLAEDIVVNPHRLDNGLCRRYFELFNCSKDLYAEMPSIRTSIYIYPRGKEYVEARILLALLLAEMMDDGITLAEIKYPQLGEV